jgi:hypothetical protein
VVATSNNYTLIEEDAKPKRPAYIANSLTEAELKKGRVFSGQMGFQHFNYVKNIIENELGWGATTNLCLKKGDLAGIFSQYDLLYWRGHGRPDYLGYLHSLRVYDDSGKYHIDILPSEINAIRLASGERKLKLVYIGSCLGAAYINPNSMQPEIWEAFDADAYIGNTNTQLMSQNSYNAARFFHGMSIKNPDTGQAYTVEKVINVYQPANVAVRRGGDVTIMLNP